MSKSFKLYREDYYEYIELLSLGNIYYILISKRLLLKPMMPIWTYLFCLFIVRSNMFFAMVGLPSLIVLGVFLIMFFPLWESCNISAKAYIVFHSTFIIILRIISIPVSMFLEVLWTLCV